MAILGNYFTASYGEFKKPFGNLRKGVIPFISSGDKENGVVGFFAVESIYKNIITVARTGSVGSSFYHPYECCVNSDCIVLTPKKEFSKEEMFMFLLQLRKNIYRYSYSRKVTPDRLLETSISEKNLKPVKNIFLEKIQKRLSKPFSSQKYSLDVENWKEFKLVKIFSIVLGRPIHKNSLKSIPLGDVNYVTRTTMDNGIHSFFDRAILEKKFITEEENAIIIGAEGFKAFYQNEKFITGNKINILRCKNLNQYTGLFLCSLLNKEIGKKFSYGRGLVKNRLEKLRIKLPVDTNGNPDWAFMENYIKSLPYSKSI